MRRSDCSRIVRGLQHVRVLLLKPLAAAGAGAARLPAALPRFRRWVSLYRMSVCVPLPQLPTVRPCPASALDAAQQRCPRSMSRSPCAPVRHASHLSATTYLGLRLPPPPAASRAWSSFTAPVTPCRRMIHRSCNPVPGNHLLDLHVRAVRLVGPHLCASRVVRPSRIFVDPGLGVVRMHRVACSSHLSQTLSHQLRTGSVRRDVRS